MMVHMGVSVQSSSFRGPSLGCLNLDMNLDMDYLRRSQDGVNRLS